jgi:hypothetical protein
MPAQLTIKFINWELGISTDIEKIISKAFQEYAAEGGLPEDFNPTIAQSLGYSIQLTDSAPDYLEFSIYKNPKRLTPIKK